MKPACKDQNINLNTKYFRRSNSWSPQVLNKTVKERKRESA